MTDQKTFWIPPADDSKVDLRYVVSIKYDKSLSLKPQTNWLDERLPRRDWSVFPTYEVHEQHTVLFWFEHSVDLDTIMLFKLTFGGK